MDSQLKEIINAFDRVFAKIGQKPLLENAEFIAHSQQSTDSFMRFDSVPKPGRISMSFEIFVTGVTFYIDRAREMPDIDYDTIKRDIRKFEGVIEMIFTSAIYCVHKGNKTVLSFVNTDNIQIGEYKFHMGIWPNWFENRVVKSYDSYFGA